MRNIDNPVLIITGGNTIERSVTGRRVSRSRQAMTPAAPASGTAIAVSFHAEGVSINSLSRQMCGVPIIRRKTGSTRRLTALCWMR